MASRSSADKLKPLPPDPDRHHQHSAIPQFVNADGASCMLSHGVRRNLPKLLAAPQSGLLLLRLGPGGSGGLPERTARFSTCYELRDLPCPTRGGYLLATLLPMRFPIAALGRLRVLSPCDGWRFQPHTRFLGEQRVF